MQTYSTIVQEFGYIEVDTFLAGGGLWHPCEPRLWNGRGAVELGHVTILFVALVDQLRGRQHGELFQRLFQHRAQQACGFFVVVVRPAVGLGNDRGDNFFSVCYWYQSEPYTDFPALPPLEARIPIVRTSS